VKIHRPRKRFGQHFLHDESVIERIVANLDPRSGQHLIEIGPGQGALTAALLTRVSELDVIELDRDLVATLAERLGRPAGLRIHAGDVLAFDFRQLADGRPMRVFGNLPYNISTALLFHLFEYGALIGDMLFMLQKEVVERLVASPGEQSYGRLSAMAGFYCHMTHLFDVSAQSFRPPPKVESAVLRLIPRALTAADLAVLPGFERVVRTAFAQRRKTLRRSLSGLLSAESIERSLVDPGARPQTLGQDAFRRLAVTLQAAD